MLRFHLFRGKREFIRCYSVMDKFVTRTPRSGEAADMAEQADSGTKCETQTGDTGTGAAVKSDSHDPAEAELVDSHSDDISDSDLVQAACMAEGDHSEAAAAKHAEAFQFVEKEGDLFGCGRDEALTHCISADVRMGKGIAVLFKRKFGGVQELLAQGQRPGGVAILKRDGRYIYYLVTKEKAFHKPTYDSMQKSLKAMRKHCIEHSVQKLAMPRIGCGLDGLQWFKVVNIIKDVFKDTDMIITAYTI